MHRKDSDLQGIVRLLSDATIGVTEVIEDMHKEIVQPPLLPATFMQRTISNIAGLTYRSIRGSTKVISNSLDKMLGLLNPLLGRIKQTDRRERLRSVVNGILGDYLEETANPLQIAMQFRYQSKPVSIDRNSIESAYPASNGKIILMVHGSCMNDLQWTHNEHNHGLALAEELGSTPLFLHYNSGRHISHNGQDLSELLEKLMQNWTVPVQELLILAHSMGGLVARSAIHYGQLHSKTWTKQLKKVVFLGTPHHGAALERIGNYLDTALALTPYARPLAPLGKIRSAGVTDLRYGNITDEDWQDYDRFEIHGDQRKYIPLPEDIMCYSIAAAIKKEEEAGSSKRLGDRLVSVSSALGQHKDPTKSLHFNAENTWVAYDTSHSDLLEKSDVYEKIKSWLL